MGSSSGKNKRRQLTVDDTHHQVVLSVDSVEEVDFVNWLNEAVSLSIVTDFTYQPDPIQLFDSVKYTDVDGKSRTLFRDHEYTPDFCIKFDPSKYHDLAKEFKIPQDALSSDCSVLVDVKGTFNKTERSFGLNQKWVYQKTGLYVHKVVPQKFFAQFGCPEESRLSKAKRQPRKAFLDCPSLSSSFNTSDQ